MEHNIKFFAIFLSFCVHVIHVNCNKKALIIGITGQDGIYLAQLLNKKNYEIHGVSRSAKKNFNQISLRLKNIDTQNLHLYSIDVSLDVMSLQKIIENLEPDEIYYLAAQSSVALSFVNPEDTYKTNVLGPLKVLETVRQLKPKKTIRLFFASSCEIINKDFKKLKEDENFNLSAVNPYGSSKLALFNLAKVYRDLYNLYVCNGILFNHESPLRPEKFLMRKISKAVAEYSLGKGKVISVGNLNSKRDFGYAKDYVEAMWLMLQKSMASDYIIANGCLISVREVIEQAFRCINITIVWSGVGLEEKGFDAETGKLLVQVDPSFFRPDEGYAICGDSSKAYKELNWKPKLTVEQLIKLMVESDIELLKNT